jgi:hypothetical protein
MQKHMPETRHISLKPPSGNCPKASIREKGSQKSRGNQTIASGFNLKQAYGKNKKIKLAESRYKASTTGRKRSTLGGMTLYVSHKQQGWPICGTKASMPAASRARAPDHMKNAQKSSKHRNIMQNTLEQKKPGRIQHEVIKPLRFAPSQGEKNR